MKIGIISDTHGSLDDFKNVMARLGDAEKIIHLGDVLYHGPRNPIPEGYNPKEMAKILSEDDRFVFIKGNCDAEVDQMVINKPINETESLIVVGDNTFYLHHGHRFTEEEMVENAKEYGANIVLYGHTHKKVLKYVDGILVVNPGSTSLPKDDSKSFAVYDDGIIKIYSSKGSLWMVDEDSLEDPGPCQACKDKA